MTAIANSRLCHQRIDFLAQTIENEKLKSKITYCQALR